MYDIYIYKTDFTLLFLRVQIWELRTEWMVAFCDSDKGPEAQYSGDLDHIWIKSFQELFLNDQRI